MKNKKYIVILSIFAIICVLFSGCAGLGDLIFGLSGLLRESTAESVSTSLPVASSSAPVSSAAPASEPAVAEEAPKAVALNTEVTAFMGQTNGAVRVVNGNVCSSYIMYGGSAVADYMGRDVAYPFAFWMLAEQNDMMAVWAEKSDGQGNAPEENIWPDYYTIDIIEAWDEAIPVLFGTEGPVSYTMLEEAYGQAPALFFAAANEGADYTYPVDTWTGTYEIEGFTLHAVFEKTGDEQTLYLVRLQF